MDGDVRARREGVVAARGDGELAALTATGALTLPKTIKTFPLSDAVDAYRCAENRGGADGARIVLRTAIALGDRVGTGPKPAVLETRSSQKTISGTAV